MLNSEESNRNSMKKVKKAKLDQIEEVVASYLQRRNYPSLDRDKTSQSAKEFTVSCLIDNGISRPNSVLYSCLNNDPIIIDQTFIKFLSWSKELIRTNSKYGDIEILIGPLFCHLYFEILRGGHADRANTFFNLHLSEIEKDKCDNLVLNVINDLNKKDDTMDIIHLKEIFRSNKYTVQLCTDSVDMLRKFLEGCHIVLLHVLQNWFVIEELIEQEQVEGEEENDVEDNMKISMEVNGIDDEQDNFTNKSLASQRLSDIINTINNSPKPVYCVSIRNMKDEVTCGVLSRAHGLIAYSYNNSIALRSLEALQQLQSCPVLGEVVLIGHSGRVYDMAVFNNYLISGSQDRTIRLYDLQDNSEKMVYYGHDYPIYCLSASLNNNFFVSGSYDRTARLWSLTRKDSLRIFIGHTQDITSVDFHPNSNYIISGSVDKNIKMWSISNAEPVRSFPGSKGTIYSVKFSADGRYLFSTGEEGTLRIWDLQAGKELVNFKVSEECCTKIAISSNEPYVAVSAIDGTFKIWNYQKMLKELSVEEPPVTKFLIRPTLLDIEYYYDTFGCLSTNKEYSNITVKK